MFVKFITQVSVTCVAERFVRLLINAGLKTAPADSCKQAEVRTWCWLAWYADQLFRCFVSLRNDTSIRGKKRWQPLAEVQNTIQKKNLPVFVGPLLHFDS